MSTKYVVETIFGPNIRAYECVKETAKFAWLKNAYTWSESAVKKKKGVEVFNTWAEAHAELTRRAEAELAAARRALQVAQGIAGNVKGMKPPQEVEG